MTYYLQLVDDILKALLTEKGNSPDDIAQALHEDKARVEPILNMLKSKYQTWFIEVKPTENHPYQIMVYPSYYSEIKAFLDGGGFTESENQKVSQDSEPNKLGELQRENLVALSAQANQAIKYSTWVIIIAIFSVAMALIALFR